MIPAIGRAREGGDDLSRIAGLLGQRAAERCAQRVEVRGGSERPGSAGRSR